MTRKDFELIASILAASKPDSDGNSYDEKKQWELTVNEFADCLPSSNANFDRERFLKACGL